MEMFWRNQANLIVSGAMDKALCRALASNALYAIASGAEQ